ncbi:DUF6678 family protein [Hymenobacter sp. BT491]|uniref:DUF6678 family protein n=1 Tax=Hymenobacter sp. BT491 TaxID=2766779 RepID=UPI0016534D66|nr:DUF6678 family protein [Hymenobacter sp. BT491]MBC6991496.1 hypothetical protein [Hymenobacter sp. BT491]
MRKASKDPITEFLYTNQFSSVMNRTKWGELADAIRSNPDFYPSVRIKYLDEEVSGTRFAGLDWEWVKYGDSRVIEWMDIDSTKRTHIGRLVGDQITDFSTWVRASLQQHSIPFSEADGIFRINGYLKPNDK